MKKSIWIIFGIIIVLAFGFYFWPKDKKCAGSNESECKKNQKCTSVLKPIQGGTGVYFDSCKDRK